MKVGTIVMMLLLVGFVFVAAGIIISDMETQYPDIDINSSWQGKYDYSLEINESAGKIEEKFKAIEEEERGWLKFLVGIAAIPTAIIQTMKIILLSMTKGIVVVTGIGSDIGIPPAIIVFGIIALIIAIIFSIVKFWRKEEYA